MNPFRLVVAASCFFSAVSTLMPGPAHGSPGGAPAKAPAPIEEKILARWHDECEKGVLDVRKVVASPGDKPERIFGLFWGEAAVIPLQFHLACSGFVPGSGRSCESFPASMAESLRYCQDVRAFADTAWAALKQGDWLAASKTMPFEKDVRPEDLDRAREIWVNMVKTGNYKAACEQAKNLGLPAGEDCLAGFIPFEGRPERCDSLKYPNEREVCREKAALAAALRSGDKGACTASPLCDALTRRKAEACAPYLSRANKLFCGWIAKEVAPMKKREEGRDKAIKDKAEPWKVKPFEPGKAKADEVHMEALKAVAAAAQKRKEAEAAAKAKAREEKAKEARAAREQRLKKRQFAEEQPMETPVDVRSLMEQLEKGRPPKSSSETLKEQGP